MGGRSLDGRLSPPWFLALGWWPDIVLLLVSPIQMSRVDTVPIVTCVHRHRLGRIAERRPVSCPTDESVCSHSIGYLPFQWKPTDGPSPLLAAAAGRYSCCWWTGRLLLYCDGGQQLQVRIVLSLECTFDMVRLLHFAGLEEHASIM